MDLELLNIVQQRMTTSYNEQLWTVALAASMSGFLITQADRLIASIDYKIIRIGIWIVTSLCVLFIILRHGVYLHYSSLLDNELPTLKDLSTTMTIIRYMVLSSGMLLYTSITVGMAIAADLTCKNHAEILKKNAE